jgi:two-component system chemotaxis sensor kinase CheA
MATFSYESLIRDYVEEALPLAERLADAFLELERRWADGDAADECLPQVMSDLHTLKGNSGMMGLAALQTLAHSLEDLCGQLGGEPDLRHPRSANLLIEGGDLMLDLIQRTAEGEADLPTPMAYLDRLARWVSGARGDEKRQPEDRDGAASIADARSGARSEPFALSSDLVQLHFQQLDTLLEMVGEAMIAKAMLAAAQGRLLSRSGANAELSDLDRAMQYLDKALDGLQARLVETRLLPVRTIFRRFTRKVRDLARERGTSVHLVTSGDETTIDKTIIDRLGEPLLHLVRNAVAHGIESPEEREQAGKSVTGNITLSARPRSDRVIIALSDDGRGLDEPKILARAEQQGLETRSLSREEILALVFRPGFSTADDVSTLSGRGVGLDVADKTIRSLGGRVSVRSVPGQGATFLIDLPLTMAVLKALVVEVDGETYAVPLSYVVEGFRLDPEAMHRISHQGALSWRGVLLPLRDGGAVLGTGRADPTGRAYCVAIAAGDNRYGLLVDRLVGHQDMVVKSLERSLGKQELISGATIAGDGKVVLILDSARLGGEPGPEGVPRGDGGPAPAREVPA